MQSSRRAGFGRRHKCAIGPVHPYYTDELRFIRWHGNFAMRPTMVSLLTLLSHARMQVPGPVDPTDLNVRLLNDPIWPAGVLTSPEVSCHASSMPPPFRAPSCSPPRTRSPHSHPRHWVRTSSRRLGTGKPPPTPNRRPSSAQAT